MKKAILIFAAIFPFACFPSDGVRTIDDRGAPLWDDSIPNRNLVNFTDEWGDANTWVQDDCGNPVIHEKIEKVSVRDLNVVNAIEVILLEPMRPRDDLWAKPKCGVNRAAGVSEINIGACPFATEFECAIWRKKPAVIETVAPRAARFRADIVAAIATNACAADADSVQMRPLVARYKMLMNAAQKCCTSGMVRRLTDAGASQGQVYKFLVDDANFNNLGDRCLMMTDNNISVKNIPEATMHMAADTRNSCLCQNREWFESLIAPFEQVWHANPSFERSEFNYKYRDGLGRDVTASINSDVKNVRAQLSACP